MAAKLRKSAQLVAAGLALAATAHGAGADVRIGQADPQAPAEDSAQFRLTVGTNGRARDCAVERSSGDPQIDAAGCRFLVRRGEWRARRDDQGRRVEYEMSVELFRSFLMTLPR